MMCSVCVCRLWVASGGNERVDKLCLRLSRRPGWLCWVVGCEFGAAIYVFGGAYRRLGTSDCAVWVPCDRVEWSSGLCTVVALSWCSNWCTCQGRCIHQLRFWLSDVQSVVLSVEYSV